MSVGAQVIIIIALVLATILICMLYLLWLMYPADEREITAKIEPIEK